MTRVIYGEGGFTWLDAEIADENPCERDIEESTSPVDCLLDHHPEAGAGTDIARRAGSSRFHVGIWMEEIT